MSSPDHVRRTAGPPVTLLGHLQTSPYLPTFLIVAAVIITLGAIAYSRMAYVESD
jgi:hypothetical protein